MKQITLITQDNVQVIGNHFSVATPSPGIALFHMMPATKEGWTSFAEKLNLAGIGVLAIDLRGHGESQGGPEGYKEYTPAQHQSSKHDVDAAIKFQDQENHSPLFVGGGSIGANLALQAIANNDKIKKAILLSPGINYHGLESIPLAEKVSANKQVFIVCAKDDVRSGGPSHEQCQKIFDKLICKKEIKIFETGGHATNILENHPQFIEELIEWLKKK